MENQPMPELRKVVLVGHCGPDMHMLKSAVSRSVPGASIVTANDAQTLQKHVGADSVLLINRVLDGRFDANGGVALIQELMASENPPVAILVSNYPDAQEAAVAAGARPGFGKSQLYAPATADKLRDAVKIE
jgi:two-component system, chemotaxis family, chemotaxis protein CheY